MAVEKGYVDAPVNPAIDLKAEILRIKKRKRRGDYGPLLPAGRNPGYRRLYR